MKINTNVATFAPHGTDGAVPVVKVKSDEPGHAKSGGFVEINASQYDPTRHTLMPGETNPITGATDGKPGKFTKPPKAKGPELSASEKEPFNKPVVVNGGKPFSVAEIVASAHAKSGMSADDWNALADGDRFVLLETELKARVAWG
jgi:hypothetical protein